MNRRAYRGKWLNNRDRYEKLMRKSFRQSIKKSVNRVKWDQLSLGNYTILIDLNINERAIEQAYIDSYLTVGFVHGRRMLRTINKESKSFSDKFDNTFKSILIAYIRQNMTERIVSVKSSLVEYLKDEIQKGIENGLDIKQIARNMMKLIRSRNFYRWQIDRIIRTETTTAANYGAKIASESSGVLTQKEWISSNDPRTRRRPEDDYDHIALNGVRIGRNEKFKDLDSELDFPGDPNGKPGSTINCRCSVVYLPVRDSEGNLVLS